MIRRLKSDQAKLGYASVMIQVANFAVILVAKAQISSEDFAFLLTQLAIAGIIGAIASMRFEMLIYQAYARMTYAAAVVPIVATLAVISVFYLGYAGIAALGFDVLSLSLLSIPMMLGLGLGMIKSFLLIQVKRINLLLISRSCQALALGALIAVLLFGGWTISGPIVLLGMGACYLIPAVAIICIHLVEFDPDTKDPRAFFVPEPVLFKRSVSLSFSTGINSVYVNLPLFLAAATQSAAFVADFGLILKCFTAPVTLIRQVIGQLFLANAITWSGKEQRDTKDLNRLVTKAVVRSVSVYLLAAPVLISVLFFNLDALNITHFEIAPYLAMAALGQCVINVISMVRVPLADERTFLWFDVMRLVSLGVGLFVLSTIIPFATAFGVTALVLYASYAFFIRYRISRYSA